VTIPLAADDPYRRSLETQAFELTSAASTYGPEGAVYSAYLFAHPVDLTRPRQELPGGFCRLAFYRWDGQTNTLVTHFEGAGYPAGGEYALGGTRPVSCKAQGQPELASSSDAEKAAYQALSVRPLGSDVNQDGFPEYRVDYSDCLNFCGGYPRAPHISMKSVIPRQ
jgi:hypothetical protein